MKYIFIVNPTSGKGLASRVANNIRKHCATECINYEMRFTEYPRHAIEIAKEYKEAKDVIVFAVGGDGTLFEVLNGLIGTKNMLGVVPAGSGNDFYKTIQYYEKKRLPVDVGKINNYYFLNIASIGIDADVASNITLMKEKGIPANKLYQASIIYTFFKFKPKIMEFTLDNDKKEDKFTLLAVCNGKSYGNGYKIAPNASINDGLFEIYFVDEVSKMSIPKMFKSLKNGTHEQNIHVHNRQNDSIKIKTPSKVICNVDGEIIVDKSFDIKLCKDAITIYNNQDFINKII